MLFSFVFFPLLCFFLLFLPLLFSYGTCLMQIRSKKQTSLCHSPNSLLSSLPLEKLMNLIAKFHGRKLKIELSIFVKVKETIVLSFRITAVSMSWDSVLLYPHIIFNPFCDILVRLKMEKVCITVTSSPQLDSSYPLFYKFHWAYKFIKPIFKALAL